MGANVVEEFFLLLLKSQTCSGAKEEISMVYEMFYREYFGRWRYMDAHKAKYTLMSRNSERPSIVLPTVQLSTMIKRFWERDWSTVNMNKLEPIVM